MIKEWGLRGRRGLYLLWHKDDYCGVHGLYHMRALYVGKGLIRGRILAHWKAKDFSEEMLVYWTFVEMQNRAAKYYEQVLLDTYSFPQNRAENHGGARLCAYLTQHEVD